jgi:hypothetical protein
VIPFTRAGETIIASVTQPESALIASLAAQIADLLDPLATPPHIDDPDAAALYASVGIGGSAALSTDPAIARLLPDAYGGDPEASTEFRGLTEMSLARRKVANARVVVATLEDADAAGGQLSLDPAETQSWLRSLTDIRLTVAARLGIEIDGQPEPDDAAEAELALRDVYDWLGWVTETLLDALEG